MNTNESPKYAVLIGDGMADLPIPSLGGKTPLEYASTPHMDRIAREGILGMARTVPEGMPPGSDVAILSIFGYDPRLAYTGRAPLEALNMGIELGANDVAIRCNMVEVRAGGMIDFSADHIESPFSEIIMRELASSIPAPDIEFHAGVSYRNIIVWRDYPHRDLPETTPPHDIQGQQVAPFLPKGTGADRLIAIMNASAGIIDTSPRIKEAAARYRGRPTSVWLWGCGRKPAIEPISKRFGFEGHTIAAVDLVHGLGRAAGLAPLVVPGVTGYLDTNYLGKTEALIQSIARCGIVFLHVEAPDESGHEGNLDHKIQAIEDFDRLVVGPVLEGLASYPDFALLVMPDHPTPISLRTHTAEPVPFAMYSSRGWNTPLFDCKRGEAFNEASAKNTGLFVEGHRLIDVMVNRAI